jgi:N-acetylmuramoyl-L-alanine amidase
MMKRITGIAFLTVSVIALLSFTSKDIRLSLSKYAEVIPPRKQKPALTTIIIDPGHGGKDPGTLGSFSRESKIALAIALKLGKAIQAALPGIKVIFTRTTDVLAGNKSNVRESSYYRADLANQSRGDLFISIHCNALGKKPGGWTERRIVSYKNKTVYTGKGKKKKKSTVKVPVYKNYYVKNEHHGTETYVWAADRGVYKGEAINQRQEEGGEKLDSGITFDLSSPEARIRTQLYEKKYFAKSLLLADMVEDEFAKSGRKSYGVKQRNEEGIWVLQATGMPSILVETGFISNTEEEKYLNSEKGQQAVAAGILRALKRYKAGLEQAR